MSNCTVNPRWSLEEIYTSRERVSRTWRGLKAEQRREDALVETGYCQGTECLLAWHWKRRADASRGWKDRVAGHTVSTLKRKDKRTRKPPALGSRFKVERRALACRDLTQGQY